MKPEEFDELARSLHHEWESPGLWSRISRQRQWPRLAALAALAAALMVGIYFAIPSRRSAVESPLLTEQAMAEAEKAEAAYRQSIDRLARVAARKLEQPATPLMKAYAEKLSLLDGAIASLRAEVDRNGFNAHLHVQMAAIYRDKQKTLEEVLRHD